jgi:hypothetical protein
VWNFNNGQEKRVLHEDFPEVHLYCSAEREAYKLKTYEQKFIKIVRFQGPKISGPLDMILRRRSTHCS